MALVGHSAAYALVGGGVMDMWSEPDAPVSREDGDGCNEDGLEV